MIGAGARLRIGGRLSTAPQGGCRGPAGRSRSVRIMAIDEQSRHALYTRLSEVLGSEHAVSLMEQLPREGGDRLATRDDVVSVRHDMNRRFDAMHAEMNRRFDDVYERVDAKIEASEHRILTAMHREMMLQTRVYFVGMVGAIITTAGIAFVAGSTPG